VGDSVTPVGLSAGLGLPDGEVDHQCHVPLHANATRSTGTQTALKTGLVAPERIAGAVRARPTFDPAVRATAALIRPSRHDDPQESWGEVSAVVPAYIARGGRPLPRFHPVSEGRPSRRSSANS
jgi:hypothetical protein